MQDSTQRVSQPKESGRDVPLVIIVPRVKDLVWYELREDKTDPPIDVPMNGLQ